MSQIDRIFELLVYTDMDDEDGVHILEAEISALSDEELRLCIRHFKKSKDYEDFYNLLLKERSFRR